MRLAWVIVKCVVADLNAVLLYFIYILWNAGFIVINSSEDAGLIYDPFSPISA